MQSSTGQAPLFAAHNSDVAQCWAPSRAFAAQPARPQTGTQASAEAATTDSTVPVYNLDNQEVGQYTLPGTIFGVPIRRDILHRVVRWQLARRQQGTHKTKTRAEVSGGGRKPRPQKGQGKARIGTIRAGQMRGGGVIHGPVVRSHEHSLNRKVRRLGMKCALARALDDHLNVLLSSAPRRSVLMVDSGKESSDGGSSLRRAAANLPWVDIIPQEGLNVYSILQRDQLFLTTSALDKVIHQLSQPIKR
ncbi:TPA: 54S ribosomal protein L4 mitochondrial [Trebouxia sp. C0006]